MCGYSCGYRRESAFGGASYAKDEPVPEGISVVKTNEGFTIPVDEDDKCIYLKILDNGFTRCTIQDKKPKMCRLFYCLPGQKARQLQTIVDELWQLQH
jgi:hypothetical protein